MAEYQYLFGCLLIKNELTAAEIEANRPPHSNSSIYNSMLGQEKYLAEKEGREPRPIPETITFKTREVGASAWPAKDGAISLSFSRRIETEDKSKSDPFDV